MSALRPKRIDIGGFVNIKVLRDHLKRQAVEKAEPERYVNPMRMWTRSRTAATRPPAPVEDYSFKPKSGLLTFCSTYRQALRYMIRNTTLPPRVRAQAQLQLTQMHAYTRPTQIRNRCVAAGVARSVIREFRMGRVCVALSSA